MLVNVHDHHLPFAADDHILFHFDSAQKYGPEVWQCFENVAFTGGIGAGKTLFAEQTWIKGMFDAGFAMLGACPKPLTSEQITGWARDRGREQDVIVVNADGKTMFPILSWLATGTKGRQGVVRVAVDFLKETGEVSERGRMTDAGGENRFFNQMSDRINHAVMTVDLAANDGISAERCLRMIQTVDESRPRVQEYDDEKNPKPREINCQEHCQNALAKCKDEEVGDVRRAVLFLIEELRNLEPRVKGNCIISATTVWAGLGEYPLNKLFGEPAPGDEAITPDLLEHGAIILINLPMSHGGSAKVAFVLWKLAVQKYLLGRPKGARPVTLYLGEGQNYVSTSDFNFTAMCRESRACYFLSTQSINNLKSEIRDTNQVQALLATINNRVYLNNTCPETNEWASQDCGEEEVWEAGMSGRKRDWVPFPDEDILNQPMQDASVSYSRKRKRKVPPEWFPGMQRGNRKDGLAEAIVRCVYPDGMQIDRIFFDVNVGQRESSWWRRWLSRDDRYIANLPRKGR
ncbi:MAG TPA: TraM recognition domain-containing protein [Bryobacteraceae bacterium]|jgi:hypothetical protein